MGKCYIAVCYFALLSCLLLSGCAASSQLTQPSCKEPPQMEQVKTSDLQTSFPVQNGAEQSAPPFPKETPLEPSATTPELPQKELLSFADDYCLQWKISEEPLIYYEHPISRISSQITILEDGELCPLEFLNDLVLQNYSLPAETLSQLELAAISPDAGTLVYRQPIAFSEPDWVGIRVPFIFRYYVFSDNNVQTFEVELPRDDWEWTACIVGFDNEVRGCLITHYGPEEYRTYTHIDFETMESTLLTETGILSDNPNELIYQLICNGAKSYACTLSGSEPAIRVVSMPERRVIMEYPTSHNDVSLCSLTDQQVTYFDSRDGIYRSISLETQEAEEIPLPDQSIDEELRNVLHSADQKIVAYYSGSDDNGNLVLTLQAVESSASLELVVPWNWSLSAILPRNAVEAYLQQ